MRALPKSKPRRFSMEQLVTAQKKAGEDCLSILRDTPFGLDWTDEAKATASMDAIRKAVMEAWKLGFDTASGELS